MAIVGGAISILVGGAVQSKMISSVRSADTETARGTLEWITERVRNAGFNLLPGGQTQLRCKDRVVAQDASLLPTTTSVFVSGEILNTDTVAGNEDLTIGYYLGVDPVTAAPVVMEYNQPCSTGATSIATYSKPLSNPSLTVTSLSFQYYDASGNTVAGLTTPATIRQIQIIGISITVQGAEGRSGVQAQTLTRYVLLRNPEPNTNNWVDQNEKF